MIGAIIGAATSIASSIAGGIKANKAAKKAKAAIESAAQKSEGALNHNYGKAMSAQEDAMRSAMSSLSSEKAFNENWYKQKQSADYTQGVEGQAMLREAREAANDQLERAEGMAAVMGGTDASVASARAQAANSMTESLRDIGLNASAERQAAEQQYLNTRSALSAEGRNLSMQHGNAMSSLYANKGNSLSSLHQSVGQQMANVYNQQAANASQGASQGMSAGMGMVGLDVSSKLQTGKWLFSNLFGK